MLAPGASPCLTASVAASMTFRNETGPEATPWGPADEAAARPEPAEIEARSAALLVHQGGVLDRVENGFHRILDRQDEAGAETHVPPRPGQVGLLGRKSRAVMRSKISRPRFPVPGRALSRGHRPGDAEKEIGR